MRFRSVHGPFTSSHSVATAPSNVRMSPMSLRWMSGPAANLKRSPAPRSSTILRQYPVKLEKGPEASIWAMLTRQRNGSPVAGTRIISWVIPPPFFHGTGATDDLRIICIAVNHTVIAAGIAATSTRHRLLDIPIVVLIFVLIFVGSGVRLTLVVDLEFFRRLRCFVGLAHGN